ncbi:T9SS type A sorting domain-containing protein [Flavobacterium psychrotolerans]|uniref:Uncharacterized protein n=1 Tax=Flavobacterium psychrotolerans TaxID=2169410 RepID=A0A2U1JR73_9FLAO|nr:T9SS type A sorting domain-containing protein [Flavobacterium psychrotolerans]PWA07328.1 hypothetical protein DB895_00985 [Flavobacterium psychrotolerans]
MNKSTLLSAIILFSGILFSQTATTTVNIGTTVMSNPKLLLGITYDCRSSLNVSGYGQAGYHNTDGSFIPEVDAVFGDFPMIGLRYPANGIMQGFEWKKSIGPIATRTAQQIFAQGNTPAQVLEFGFDEFMAMTAARGTNPKNVQLMIPIYDSADNTLKSTQQNAAVPNVVQSNADWVEYANAPNDNSNPGGGTDWAAVRAINGHPAPYGIELWNLGNEPYTPNEFDTSGVNSYITMIVPIIDAMRAIDPTIKITVTVTGKALSAWTNTVLNSPLLQGKIYGINSHAFITEEVINNAIPYGVNTYETAIKGLSAAAKIKGYKFILGDNAHAILGAQPTAAVQDLAMQWQGANTTMDFLLMMSQIDNLERSNFWAYGLASAQWHPIRKNANGTYTSMPVAELYKKLNSVFLDNSISTISTSPIASDTNPYSVRSGAFASADLSKLNIIAVNRDKLITIPMQINGTTNYTISNARVLTATSLSSDVIIESTITPDINGNYSMPAMSILILEYSRITLDVNESISETNSITLYPNPANDSVTLKRNTNKDLEIKIYNTLGQLVKTESLKENNPTINVACLKTGTYMVAIKSKEFTINRKLIINR